MRLERPMGDHMPFRDLEPSLVAIFGIAAGQDHRDITRVMSVVRDPLVRADLLHSELHVRSLPQRNADWQWPPRPQRFPSPSASPNSRACTSSTRPKSM